MIPERLSLLTSAFFFMMSYVSLEIFGEGFLVTGCS